MNKYVIQQLRWKFNVLYIYVKWNFVLIFWNYYNKRGKFIEKSVNYIIQLQRNELEIQYQPALFIDRYHRF